MKCCLMCYFIIDLSRALCRTRFQESVHLILTLLLYYGICGGKRLLEFRAFKAILRSKVQQCRYEQVRHWSMGATILLYRGLSSSQWVPRGSQKVNHFQQLHMMYMYLWIAVLLLHIFINIIFISFYVTLKMNQDTPIQHCLFRANTWTWSLLSSPQVIFNWELRLSKAKWWSGEEPNLTVFLKMLDGRTFPNILAIALCTMCNATNLQHSKVDKFKIFVYLYLHIFDLDIDQRSQDHAHILSNGN